LRRSQGVSDKKWKPRKENKSKRRRESLSSKEKENKLRRGESPKENSNS
jgi:hypothetical protein